jgi:lipopolysaccharide/colanic/teichoic acid biosynthesis glycosyltransferase
MGAAARRRAEVQFDERAVVQRVLSASHVGGEPRRGRRRRRLVAPLVKRAMDVVLSAAALVVLAPVMAVIAIVVRIALGKPVLFRQLRPGLDGELFTLRKCRTMRDGSGPDEERLTRLGRMLRSTSLDELPELVNILRGEMSLVGPRPLLVRYLDRYTPEQARRHEVRPGLTGWAQVKGRNATTWEERLALDVWYVDHWSIRLDLRIIATTARNVLRREGISQEGHATMPELPPRDPSSSGTRRGR